MTASFTFDNKEENKNFFTYLFSNYPLSKYSIINNDITKLRKIDNEISCYYFSLEPTPQSYAILVNNPNCLEQKTIDGDLEFTFYQTSNESKIVNVDQHFNAYTQNNNENDLFKLFLTLHTNKEKMKMIDEVFSTNESTNKNWKFLNFVCKQYLIDCKNLPLWEQQMSLINIINYHLKTNKHKNKTHYWMKNAIKDRLLLKY